MAIDRFSREPIQIVEIDMDYCSLTAGVAPCTATETGDAKCFNTFKSCNDPQNYVKEVKTYRFCTDVSPLPSNLEAFPFIERVTTAPAEIDLSGGLGVRASASVSFTDAPASDIGIDKYLDERSYIATERGTFWTKFRARNPFYIGRPLRVISAYIVDGLVDYTDAVTRHYVIDKIDASDGACSITAKDTLKLADNKRAKAPLASRGQLAAQLDELATTAALSPTGVGAEYPTSGFIRVRSEVMGFTRSGDSLTLTRGQYNTVATEHSAGDTAQLCLEYKGELLNNILEDLLINYSGVNAAFIPSSEWADEVSSFLPGGLSALITEPTGVQTLLKELGEQFPHYLYWDERTQLIKLSAVKPPPINAPTYDMESHIIADSVRVSDKPDMRFSTVTIYFGQFDPTRKLDETNNYQQIYSRVDSDSVVQYGSNETKTIYSRWLTNLNKAGAVRCAARLGRRFSDIPRSITFALDDKDRALWAGDTAAIEHRDVTDFTGAPLATDYQIISVQERNGYTYTGIQYNYAPAIAEDDFDEELTIRIGADVNNINIRAIFDELFPAADPEDETVRFIVEEGVVVGSTSTASAAIRTGSWPSTTQLILDNRGVIAGRGGHGAYAGGTGGHVGTGGNGGVAVVMQSNLTLVNLGIIGGGGGGGAADEQGGIMTRSYAAGGGGAGRNPGIAGTGTGSNSAAAIVTKPEDGSLLEGGAGGHVFVDGDEPFAASGGLGGDLGENGQGTVFGGPGGTAGNAIERNGFNLTYNPGSDIRGAVV